jgi:hypothetical protein
MNQSKADACAKIENAREKPRIGGTEQQLRKWRRGAEQDCRAERQRDAGPQMRAMRIGHSRIVPPAAARFKRQIVSTDAGQCANSARQIANWADVIFERYMPSLKCCVFVDFRPADPVHAKMTEGFARWIPGHQIP